jgi:hypothetical protein
MMLSGIGNEFLALDDFAGCETEELVSALEVTGGAKTDAIASTGDHSICGAGVWFIIDETVGAELGTAVSGKIELPPKDQFTGREFG